MISLLFCPAKANVPSISSLSCWAPSAGGSVLSEGVLVFAGAIAEESSEAVSAVLVSITASAATTGIAPSNTMRGSSTRR